MRPGTHEYHEYLSTSCLHGDMTLPDGRTGHQYCQGDTGHAGTKRPAECKFCRAPCVCECHPATRVLYLDTFAAQIREERRARGWSQRDLADRVGVKQQAVSGWERGRALPKATAVERVRRVLGFTRVAEADLDRSTVEPIAIDRLPLQTLNSSSFVDFAVDLLRVALPGVLVEEGPRVRRHGIDLYFRMPTGERSAVACERLAKFHPASFYRVLGESANAKADQFLLLVTATVTDSLMARIAETNWEIWDADVLHEKLHSLGPDQAQELIEQYFPDLGAPFAHRSAHR